MLKKFLKSLAVICTIAAATAMCACGGSVGEAEVVEEPVYNEGWKTTAPAGSLLTDEEQEMIAPVFAEISEIQPYAVLAEQVVAGTNYALLCLEEGEESGDEWTVAVVSKDLDNNLSLLSVATINPVFLNTVDEESKEPAAGGFTCTAPKVDSNVLPEAAKDAPVALTPIQQIATQEDKGTNILWLCRGEDDKGNADIYAVFFHEDDQGKSTLTSCARLDMKAYTDLAFEELETEPSAQD